MMEGITLVAVVAAAMEVIIVLEIDVGEEYLRLKRELGLMEWYQREEVDESEIVVKLAMADGEVVWCHGWGLFHLYFFVKMGVERATRF